MLQRRRVVPGTVTGQERGAAAAAGCLPDCLDLRQHANSQATVMFKGANIEAAGLVQATALPGM